jgi:hypothetical protein
MYPKLLSCVAICLIDSFPSNHLVMDPVWCWDQFKVETWYRKDTNLDVET